MPERTEKEQRSADRLARIIAWAGTMTPDDREEAIGALLVAALDDEASSARQVEVSFHTESGHVETQMGPVCAVAAGAALFIAQVAAPGGAGSVSFDPA